MHTPPHALQAEKSGTAAPDQALIWDAVILGAGASGLFCAMTAASRGRRVLLVDHASGPGRKLSITGGGKCNVTNRRVSPEDYFGANPDFCRSALARFTPADLIAWLEAAGVGLEEREHGQIFCSRSAKDLVRLLVERCRDAGCAFALEERVLGVRTGSGPGPRSGTDGSLFLVRTDKQTHAGRAVVVALGSPAWPQVGATGAGYELARNTGHAVTPVRPALAGLILPADQPLAGLSGITVPATIRLLPGAETVGPETKTAGGTAHAGRGEDGRHGGRKGRRRSCRTPGEPAARELSLLFTHNGISGPAALQASLYWRPGMRLVLDFLPSLPEHAGLDPLLDAPGAGKTLCRNAFKKMLPQRLCDRLFESLPPDGPGNTRCAELGRTQRDLLVAAFRAHTVTPIGTEGFSKAEVAAGGVGTEQLSSKTMQSRVRPGLFFCGEVLDVTGRLGGYNLQWAFASGKAAGEAL